MTAHVRIRRYPVIPISLQYLFNVATQLEPLAGLPHEGASFGDVALRLLTAQQTLQGLYGDGSLYGPYLRISRPHAVELLTAILAHTREADFGKVLAPFALIGVTQGYEQYRIAFLAELGGLSAYFVTQKGSFDTIALLSFGEALFPSDLSTKVPDAIFDAREAGKCLAFDVPTACGFHAFRATETVLRKYYTHVTGGQPLPKVRNIVAYVRSMRSAKCGEEKTLVTLEQMARHHRNPLIHPEAALTLDEAMSTLGIARSVVTAMLAELPVILQTTATAATPGQPAP